MTKPLSEITNEDAISIANLGGHHTKVFKVSCGKHMAEQLMNGKTDGLGIEIFNEKEVKQYLKDKGYKID